MTEVLIIRRAFEDDYQRAADSAFRFAKRHGIKVDMSPYAELVDIHAAHLDVVSQVETHIEALSRTYLRKLWRGCFRRAVREADATGFGWGSVIQSRWVK